MKMSERTVPPKVLFIIAFWCAGDAPASCEGSACLREAKRLTDLSADESLLTVSDAKLGSAIRTWYRPRHPQRRKRAKRRDRDHR